ncbi:hypothetical protein CHUAL_006992 [Chamberlinius hualienensis]
MKLIAVFFVAYFLQSCTAQDPSTQERLRQFLFGKYNKEIVPLGNETNPFTVILGLSVININKIELRSQTLDIDGWVQYKWSDSRLTWNPKEYDNINVIRVTTNRLWIPDVTVYNSVNSKDQEWSQSSKTRNALVYSNGDVLWIPATSLQVYCNLDMTLYPYDEHTCTVKFGSWTYDGFLLDIVLRPDVMQSLDLSELSNNTEWLVVSSSSNRTETYYPCCKEPYPAINFNLKLRRNSPIYQAAVLIPIISGIILAFSAFILSPISKGRQALNAANLFIFLITLFNLQNQLPSVGNDAPAIILICETMILLLSLGIGWNAITRTITKRMKATQPPRMVQWLNNSWPTKVLMVSRGDKISNQMQDYYRKENEIGQGGKDGEMVAIVSDDKFPVYNGWMIFFSLLDRIAFISFVLIIIALTISFTR